MATTSTTGPTTTGTAPLAWAVLALAIAQAVAPGVTFFGPGTSPSDGGGGDLLITPAGWTFAIWGVIYTLAIVHAVLTLRRGPETTSRRLQIDQVVLYGGAVLWITLAALDNSVATAAGLTLMALAAVDGILTTAREHRDEPLTVATVGVYAGWVTAAFFLNLASALVALDLVSADGLGWQLVVLALAAIALAAVLIRTRGPIGYLVAAIWA